MSDVNPYSTPKTDVHDIFAAGEVRYAGFWLRVGAMLIDDILLLLIIMPLLWLFYGEELLSPNHTIGILEILLQYIFPLVATLYFWRTFAATPGKMLVKAKIVDAKTGGPISTGQAVGRYFAYILSILPLGLGFLWVAFDKRKQGWHDKLAGTVVIRS